MKKNTDFAQMKDFQELNEKELQEIRGGDIRLPYIIKNYFQNNIK